MRSENIAILMLFILIVILVFQLCVKRLPHERFKVNKNSADPYRVLTPETIEDIQNILTDNPGQTIRVCGGNSTFNDISLTDDIIIRTERLNKITHIDKIKKQITVEAGALLKDVCDHLTEKQLALACLPEDLTQTVGSACATAAHGSNIDVGTFSDQIVDLTVILGNGNIRRVEFDDPEFPAYAVSIGCLGIIYSITLSCIDDYLVVTHRKIGHWNTFKNKIIDFLEQDPLTQLKINPNTLQTTVILCKKASPSNIIDDPEITKATPYHKAIFRTTPPTGDYTKSEMAIPYERVTQAIDDVLKLYNSHKQISSFNCDRELLIRFTGPDYNAWFSPSSGRTSAWIQFSNSDNDNNKKFFQDYEDLLLYKYSGRPNWSTSNFLNQYKIRLLYGISLDYVKRVRDRFDPQKVFSNEFIAKIFD